MDVLYMSVYRTMNGQTVHPSHLEDQQLVSNESVL